MAVFDSKTQKLGENRLATQVQRHEFGKRADDPPRHEDMNFYDFFVSWWQKGSYNADLFSSANFKSL